VLLSDTIKCLLTMDILTFTKCDWIKCLSSSRRHRSKRVNWKKISYVLAQKMFRNKWYCWISWAN
jgi:hypothetical protein